MTDRRFILTIDLIRHNKRLPTITNKIEQLSIISNFFLLNIHLIQGKIVLFFSGPFILNDWNCAEAVGTTLCVLNGQSNWHQF